MCDTKTCSKCKTSYPATTKYFRKHRGSKDGLYSWCKQCVIKKRDELSWSDRLINLTKHSNRSKINRSKITHNITKHDLEELYKKQNGLCYYSNIKLDIERKCKFKSISCDRINNKLGYESGNIVLCCRFFNLGRCDGEFNEFKEFLNESILNK
jgi:hypothetical protein